LITGVFSLFLSIISSSGFESTYQAELMLVRLFLEERGGKDAFDAQVEFFSLSEGMFTSQV